MNGTIITGTGLATVTEASDATKLVTLAGDRCINETAINRNDIELIIFTGIYRENNVGEPAIASLLQRALKINNDPLVTGLGKSTFSFDLLNGPAGLLNAFQITDSFFIAATYQKALIISGDIHPSGQKKEDFSYSTIYTALLLEYIEGYDKGFSGCLTCNSDNGKEHLYTGHVDFQYFQHQSRDNVTIKGAVSYRDELLSITTDTIIEFMQAYGLKPNDLDHLIISQPDHYFHLEICHATGIKPAVVVDSYSRYGNPHSSGLSAAYILGLEQKRYQINDRILFVAAGAGLTVACCLYIY
jgi:3-oxoacyl-[acyl-carrier-protein] synthase III